MPSELEKIRKANASELKLREEREELVKGTIEYLVD